MRFSFLLLSFLFLGFTSDKPQDSPVTSTDFHKAYLEIPLIAEAATTHTMTTAMEKFLLKRRTPIDQKAALVNALGWSQTNTPNFDAFAAAVKKKRKIHTLTPDSKMKAHDQLMLGYLLLLEDYFNPQNASPYLEKAAARLPNSRTAQTLLAICRAQISFDGSWCEVWRHYEKVRNNTELKDDIRKDADQVIYDYLVLYQDSCN